MNPKYRCACRHHKYGHHFRWFGLFGGRCDLVWCGCPRFRRPVSGVTNEKGEQ